MKKIKKMGIGGLPAGSPNRTVPMPGRPMPGRPLPMTQPLPGRPMPGRPLPMTQPLPGPPMPDRPMPRVARVPIPQIQQPAGGRPNLPIAAPTPAVAGAMKKGGKVSSASKRADGCAVKGKTRGKMV